MRAVGLRSLTLVRNPEECLPECMGDLTRMVAGVARKIATSRPLPLLFPRPFIGLGRGGMANVALSGPPKPGSGPPPPWEKNQGGPKESLRDLVTAVQIRAAPLVAPPRACGRARLAKCRAARICSSPLTLARSAENLCEVFGRKSAQPPHWTQRAPARASRRLLRWFRWSRGETMAAGVQWRRQSCAARRRACRSSARKSGLGNRAPSIDPRLA